MRISNQHIAQTIQQALQQGLVSQEDDAAIFYDLDLLEAKLALLATSFPQGTLHTVAIKANPLPALLQRIIQLGFGLEAATIPELQLALNADAPPHKIVYDSPTKTVKDLTTALKAQVHINADSLQELERIQELLPAHPTHGNIGLRINPQVGVGTIESTSVAGQYSKFGTALSYHKAAIIQAYKSYPWLNSLHLHIGSQGYSVNMLVQGIKKVYQLMLEINKARPGNPIKVFDIGGGLPAAYHDHAQVPSFKEYATALQKELPNLFTNRYQLVTEFGRHVHANAGWVMSRVEYVKQDGPIKTCCIHVGADMFIRECYNPNDWHHEVTLVNSHGILKQGQATAGHYIAGPLCFAGDIVAKDVALPLVTPGDYIIIKDVGAYTFGMWSRYNSRQMPKVLQYATSTGLMSTIKEKESVDQALGFWG